MRISTYVMGFNADSTAHLSGVLSVREPARVTQALAHTFHCCASCSGSTHCYEKSKEQWQTLPGIVTSPE